MRNPIGKELPLLFLGIIFWSACGATVQAQAVDSFTETEAGSVIVPETKADSITAGGTGKVAMVAVDAGFAGGGSTIPIPTGGFTAADCKFTAAVANVQGSALSTSVSINKTTGEVVSQKVVQERVEVPPTTKNCVASYTVICVKNAP